MSEPTEKAPQPRPYRILVVEDDPSLQLGYQEYLVLENYLRENVRVAENGQKALELIQQGFKPDLILTDLEMPEMDGIILAQAVRSDSDPQINSIPIILHSSRDRDKIPLTDEEARNQRIVVLSKNDFFEGKTIQQIDQLLTPPQP